MVTLGPPVNETDFDYVGVERPLGQELRAADLGGVLLEDVDEQRADGLALLLGSVTPSSAFRKASEASPWTRGMLSYFQQPGPFQRTSSTSVFGKPLPM